MPADDHPFDALKKQLEMEALGVSRVTKVVRDLIANMPFWSPFDKVAEFLKERLVADQMGQIRLMLETCMNEVRKHENEIKQLREVMTQDESQLLGEVLSDLLLDAARKAENTRAKERVRRIGLILANAAVGSKGLKADETEEMMRVAMELNDRDIEFLKELIRIEGSTVEAQDHISRYDAHQKWVLGWWRDRVDPEIDSVFSKLESFGLVARLAPPNNLNITADFQNRYVLLKKGLRFATLVQEA